MFVHCPLSYIIFRCFSSPICHSLSSLIIMGLLLLDLSVLSSDKIMSLSVLPSIS